MPFSYAPSLVLTATLGTRVTSPTGRPINGHSTACSQASKAADYLRGLALAELSEIAA